MEYFEYKSIETVCSYEAVGYIWYTVFVTVVKTTSLITCTCNDNLRSNTCIPIYML